MPGARTLSIDCGGGGIKGCVLDTSGTLLAPPVRRPTPYPLPPERLLGLIAGIADELPEADRATVGMPGMIRHGVVVHTPHYITRSGPRTRQLPELEKAWQGFDMAAAIRARLGLPAVVLNDAEVHGAGVVDGIGCELVLTLGTGLGSALFDDGALAPHLELSHAQVRWGLTYDGYLGEHERLRLGDSHWSRRVRRAIDSLHPVVRWDRLYLGGGNGQRVVASTLARLGPVTIIPNSAALLGGVRVWSLPRA
ncbi:polyphosphate glucokinase [Salana multivorans]|uniref:Polyphosphate glucokinase n=1 Tax=Salana multivorans TaxID=120377 RepID=A0A3N2DD64_9MICO|nr:ROK family protein [Salana multivorans]MBN8883446.1 ROK family protein [Salana multivorans]OJX97777.1 MAG: hypothetical protein BGO96_12635 [Micrococcales bacterium 73-15]ROR97374.1 polyphosphate glucokinase [Salana multivorans]